MGSYQLRNIYKPLKIGLVKKREFAYLMADTQITTKVDELMALLESVEKIPLTDAARRINMSEAVVQKWVDFMVQEKKIGVEYHLTTPYIFLIRDTFSFISKEEFFKKAKMRGVEEPQAAILWQRYLNENKDLIRRSFFEHARAKKLKNVGEEWKKFEAAHL